MTTYTMTRMRWIPLFSLVAILMASCTSSRYASSTEYDDVYFTSADRVAEVAAMSERISDEPATQYNNDNYSYTPQPRREVDNYGDYYYGDDDFTFSRRMRRFNNSPSANWRYYDPYYSNDLYFVMGTSYWNRWNNNGWYDWNRPRFGAYNYGNGYDPFFNDPFFNNGWGGYGTYSYNYYNPWVGSFYGYNPGYGAFNQGFRNGYNAGFNNGFYNGFYGNSAYYCPPITTSRNTGGGLWNQAAQNRATSRPVTSSRRSTPSNTRVTNRNPSQRNVNNTPVNNTKVATKTTSSTDYTRPRSRDTRRVYNPNQPTNAAPSRTTGERTPSTTTNRTTRQSSTSRQPRTSSSRPSSSPSSSSRPSRSTRPSSSASPSRTQRQPRTSTSRPSSSSRQSARPSSRSSRPSSSSSRTSRPSSSYRPSSSSSSSRSSARPSSSSRSSSSRSSSSSSRTRRP